MSLLYRYRKLLLPHAPAFLPHKFGGWGRPRAPDPRRAALIGLVVTLLLILGGWLLTRALDRAAKLQDCVMSGRTNCAPIDASGHPQPP
jgi:hypothetical protein